MKRSSLTALLFCAAWGSSWSMAATDNRLSGSLTSVGSDTASALVTRWAHAFHIAHPRVRIQIQATGSASAPIALTEAAADIGSMSRPMNASEIAYFSARQGHAPTRIIIAHDAIVVFVHPDNPLSHITLPQLDALYSATRRCGAGRPLRRWGDLGVDTAEAFGAAAVLTTGRNASSGTFELFRELALCNGRYRPEVIAWPGNGAVVTTVAANREAIGYAGIGYVNGLVKPLAIADAAGETGVAPDLANVTSGRYPLTRALYAYVNRAPGRALAGLQAAFLAYALSDESQELVRQEGFIPLDPAERRTQRSILD